MHDNRASTEARVARFVRDHLAPALHPVREPLSLVAWETPGEPVPFATARDADFSRFTVGDAWGRPWGTTWIRATGVIPEHWRVLLDAEPSRLRIEAAVDIGFRRTQAGFQAEALAYDIDGRVIKGVSPFNDYVTVSGGPGDQVDFFLEMASNPDVANEFDFRPTSLGSKATAGSDPIYRFERCELVLVDTEVWGAIQDFAVLSGLMEQLDPGLPRRSQILSALEHAIDALDPDDIASTVAEARGRLQAALAARAADSAHTLFAVGHAHIDSAWLWPVRETVRKVARTFSNALSLMDESPDYVFAASSAQQYAWLRDRYPELFERVRGRVAEGRFLPVGGMWVESDTNLPSGESLVRQLTFGKRFFLEEFGVESAEVWLPDSFGYSAALPQIIDQAGARWFLTQKPSWNKTNRMPHHTFLWEGVDGTRIFTHFPPVDKYNSDLAASDLAHAQRNFADKRAASVSLLPYGWGDGGGGPTREMYAVVERTGSLDGSPKLRSSTSREFFETAEREYVDPPVWAGELYLEAHRGTYTSQARTKLGNHDAEQLLHRAELWSATAAIRSGFAYPTRELEEIWKQVLLLQFHDILPGTSIAWVHREAEATYDLIRGQLHEIIDNALRALAGEGDVRMRVNSGPFPIDGTAPFAVQKARTPVESARASRDADGIVLANSAIRVRVDHRGLIVGILDLETERELIPDGEAANLLQLHRDIPNEWDAWDIDEHYQRNRTDLDDTTAEIAEPVVEDGTASVVVVRRFGQSVVTQRILVDGTSPAVRISTDVDWHERQKLLKLSSAFDVRADRTTAGVQFGHVERALHQNTSWEAAKFEFPAHRWVHVGEPGFGVTLTNSVAFGHDASRTTRVDGGTTTTLRQTLLHAPLYPDPETDQGRHRFETAIAIGSELSAAVQFGYAADGLLEPELMASREVAPIISTAAGSAVIETVKLADDGSGDLVVRAYEYAGERTTMELVPDFVYADAVVVDLLERPWHSPHAARLNAVGNPSTVTVTLRPQQLVTIRFRGVTAGRP